MYLYLKYDNFIYRYEWNEKNNSYNEIGQVYKNNKWRNELYSYVVRTIKDNIELTQEEVDKIIPRVPIEVRQHRVR